MLSCNHCNFFTFLTEEFFNHVLLQHTVSSIPRINCGFLDCPMVFSTLKRFEKHVFNYHSNRESTGSNTKEDEYNEQCDQILKCTY